MSPRNLILFSDGTGNSAGKLNDTNVWRLYQAVDLVDPQHPPDPRQFAFYDDGVGTSTFKPLAMLGGAFGVGLANNVVDLYVFLCRMYQPGDRIYAFGFSRGAFTIRVLIGLIMTQGLLRYEGSESELLRLSREAYRDYRAKRFTSRSPLVWLIRHGRDAALALWNGIRRRPPYAQAKRVGADPHAPDAIRVRFVGLWDTVDAYGLPVDELTRAIDKWIWPLTMRDYNCSRRVQRACHALALDDERNAFHPRLWNEADDPQDPQIGVVGGNRSTRHIRDEVVSQLWFAGVHANVGGGYPDDSLSHVSLEWMMREAEACGLRFEKAVWEQLRALSDENGRLYDSRSGIGGYYRYNPRRIEQLVHTDQVQVPRVKVHESALRRIRAGHDGYAPCALPPGFAVVKMSGDIVDGDDYLRAMQVAAPAGGGDAGEVVAATPAADSDAGAAAHAGAPPAARPATAPPPQVASPTAPAAPAAPSTAPSTAPSPAPSTAPEFASTRPGGGYARGRERVFDIVWKRRVAYFLSLAVTLALVAMPLFAPGTDACRNGACFLTSWLGVLAWALPSFTGVWLDAFTEHPEFFLPLVAALVVLLQWSSALERRIGDAMRAVWYGLPGLQPPGTSVCRPLPSAGDPPSAIQRLRAHAAYRGFFRLLTHRLLPFGFVVGVGYLALAAVVQLAGAWQGAGAAGLRDAAALCRPQPAQAAADGSVVFDVRQMCAPVAAASATTGATYRVRIVVPASHRWRDRETAVGPNGVECRDRWDSAAVMALGVPLRRHITQPWFRPMLRIGIEGNDSYPLLGLPQTARRADRCAGAQAPVSTLAPVATGCPADLQAGVGAEVFEARIVARSSGPLFLYVNDALALGAVPDLFYANNSGCALVTVTQELPAPVALR